MAAVVAVSQAITRKNKNDWWIKNCGISERIWPTSDIETIKRSLCRVFSARSLTSREMILDCEPSQHCQYRTPIQNDRSDFPLFSTIDLFSISSIDFERLHLTFLLSFLDFMLSYDVAEEMESFRNSIEQN